jgi:hypothetical protein
MPVGQEPARDERRILEFAYPERQVDALGDLIDYPFSDKYLDADVGIGCLECADQRRKQ